MAHQMLLSLVGGVAGAKTSLTEHDNTLTLCRPYLMSQTQQAGVPPCSCSLCFRGCAPVTPRAAEPGSQPHGVSHGPAHVTPRDPGCYCFFGWMCCWHMRNGPPPHSTHLTRPMFACVIPGFCPECGGSRLCAIKSSDGPNP